MYCVDQTRQEQAQEGSKHKKGERDSWRVVQTLKWLDFSDRCDGFFFKIEFVFPCVYGLIFRIVPTAYFSYTML